MKFFLLSLMLLCLIGCGKGENHQTSRRSTYPALTESPPPLLPPNPGFSEVSVRKPEPRVLPNNEMPESWMDKQLKKETLIKDLKDQAARADPNDPFALTEEVIEELSKIDDLAIH